MGLTSWQGSVVRKGDVVIAKNYLNADEIDTLNRLVNIFLEAAELRVKERKDLTISYWRKNVDALLDFQDKPLLKGKGSITAQESEERARRIYDEFQQLRKRQEAVAADMEDLKFLDQIAEDIKDKKDT